MRLDVGGREGKAHPADVLVLDSAKQLDAVAQQRLVLVTHLVQLDNLRPVAA